MVMMKKLPINDSIKVHEWELSSCSGSIHCNQTRWRSYRVLCVTWLHRLPPYSSFISVKLEGIVMTLEQYMTAAKQTQTAVCTGLKMPPLNHFFPNDIKSAVYGADLQLAVRGDIKFNVIWTLIVTSLVSFLCLFFSSPSVHHIRVKMIKLFWLLFIIRFWYVMWSLDENRF